MTDTMHAVPVLNLTESKAPEFGSVQSVVIPTSSMGLGYVQLLQRRPKRHRARIYVDSLPSGVLSTVTRYSTAAGPVAGQILCTCTVPANATPGMWDIRAATMFNGAGVVAATDSDNVEININGVGVATVITDVAAVNSNSFPLTSYGSFYLNPGDVVTLTLIASTAGTVIYRNELAISPAAGTTGIDSYIVYNSVLDTVMGPNPRGGMIAAPGERIWESERPLYATAVGSPVTVTVHDESFLITPRPDETIIEPDYNDGMELDDDAYPDS